MSDHSPNASPAHEEAERTHGRRQADLVRLHMPIDGIRVSLLILAVLASLTALHVARAVFIPLLLGLMTSYALSPLVDRMERLRIPRALGAALLIGAIGAAGCWTAYSLSDDATVLIESMPGAMEKVHQTVRAQRGRSESAIDKVQRAAAQLEQAAQEGGPFRPASARGVTRVSIERTHFNVKDYLVSGTLGIAESIGQGLMIVFIAYFLMVSGSSYRRKMVKIAGPTFAKKRITVEVLDEITEQIHRYLLVQVFTSTLVGVAIWLTFLSVRLEHAAVWGVVAFVLNFIPYLGTIVLTAGAALVAFVQFGTVNMAGLVAGIALVIHVVSGNLLTPWLTSKTSRINAVTAFVGVLAFGWLWGPWGLLLGVPLLTTIKAVCDHVDTLTPIGELLGS